MITDPDGASEIGVPEMVRAGPPGVSVEPATTMAEGPIMESVWLPIISGEEAEVPACGMEMVELPTMTAPDGSREIGVPKMVTAGPPAVIVEPATTMAEGPAAERV